MVQTPAPLLSVPKRPNPTETRKTRNRSGDIPKVLVRLYPALPTPQWLLGKQKLVVAWREGASGS
jgi:hypothetical protein